jgi:hypothetical protein
MTSERTIQERGSGPRHELLAQLSLAMIIAAIAASPARAQSDARPGTRSSASISCAPLASSRGPTFVWGNEAGTLRPRRLRLWADGSLDDTHARTRGRAEIADSVRALATEARRSAFWTTVSPPITHPTHNPDLAREYVAVALTCGHRRSLYPVDAEPPAFSALLRRLNAIARLAEAR